MSQNDDDSRDPRVEHRAELLPEELAAGSDDPQAQAESILEESDERTEIVDMLSAGSRVAFQVRIDGAYAGGLKELDGHEGTRATLYATGIAGVENGAIGTVRAVTDRYTMERRVLAAAKR